MSLRMLYYCRPRVLVLTLLLSLFSLFNFLYWLQYAAITNISSLMFCLGSILSFIGTLTLFLLYMIPFQNEKLKQFAAILCLFGGVLLFIASIFEMDIDSLYCGAYYFCEIHVFGYMLLPFLTLIIVSMDEFFLIFYYNARLRICVYSCNLCISSIVFIPYYYQLNIYNQNNINIEDDERIKILKINMEYFYIVLWSGVFLSSSLMILLFGVCKMNQCKFKNLISWISSILMCSGAAILILSYILQSKINDSNMENLNINDPIICYYFLVCTECWIVSVDAIVGNSLFFNHYQNIDDIDNINIARK